MGRGPMASDTDDFYTSGPYHLTSIDWTNSHHRTSVVSSLVNGVYTLERDRLLSIKKRYRYKLGLRHAPKSLAEPWWEFFNFELMYTLTDDDGSIYGAVFEYKSYSVYQNSPHVKVPHYVMAFRGTVLKKRTWEFDLKLDLQCIFNTLHQGGRSRHAVQAVRSMVDKHSQKDVWLAGHSLGAALVLLAGKTMTSVGFFLESYIFNPPISSIPLEQLPGGHYLKDVFQTAKSVVKGTIAMTLTHLLQGQEEYNTKTASWIPNLYVNPKDPICAGYIDYFRHRDFMSEIGAGQIERFGARNSVRSLLVGIIRRSPSDLSKEPLHLLLSADMTVNKNEPTKSTTAHALHQWWEKDTAMRENWESCCIRPYHDGQLTLEFYSVLILLIIQVAADGNVEFHHRLKLFVNLVLNFLLKFY
ncbi:PREDICTED: GDSL esterase/lipase At4g10955 [Camelina sativa]|uniref:GDSL esterase/lipase At4g10955 n=1 Tax=Camelina sativa TaxID=90675 RepID=A0ABM0T5N8_CAMSA|nr:PREDICTED: GDSL esterase/lipase At4g10955 [Camelina sativa]